MQHFKFIHKSLKIHKSRLFRNFFLRPTLIDITTSSTCKWQICTTPILKFLRTANLENRKLQNVSAVWYLAYMQKLLDADLICKLLGCYKTELSCFLDIYARCFHAEGGGKGREGGGGREGGREGERERAMDRDWEIERERQLKESGMYQWAHQHSVLCPWAAFPTKT